VAADRPGFLVDPKHLAEVGRAVPEDHHEGPHALVDEAQENPFGHGDVGALVEQPVRECPADVGRGGERRGALFAGVGGDRHLPSEPTTPLPIWLPNRPISCSTDAFAYFFVDGAATTL
jgi:hypothetical protein